MVDYITPALVILVFIHVFFVLAFLKKDNSIMTFGWAVGLVSIELAMYWRLQSPDLLQTVVLVTVAAWALRLFLRTLIRNLKRGYEDFRYKELRDNTESNFLVKSYIQFFLVQGVFMYIIGLPLIVANSDDGVSEELTILHYLGLIVFIAGFLIETLADFQLDRFKVRNDGEAVLSSGLWKYSRHPNYFGESLAWWGITLLVVSASTWWVLLSPLILTLTLRFVSGVPLVEARYDNNQDYQDYKSRTSSFIVRP